MGNSFKVGKYYMKTKDQILVIIKKVIDKRNLQTKYFKQLIEVETPEVSEQASPQKQLLFKPNHQ